MCADDTLVQNIMTLKGMMNHHEERQLQHLTNSLLFLVFNLMNQKAELWAWVLSL